MSRLKTLFAAAGAAVAVGGLTLADALQQEAAIMDPPMSCAEYAQSLGSFRDTGEWVTFFVGAASSALPPPQAYGGRPLGACDATGCTIARTDCPGAELRYPLTLSPVVSTRRVAMFRAPVEIAKGWRAWTVATAGTRFLRSLAQAWTECRSIETATNCYRLLGPLVECWRRVDGTLCRHTSMVAGVITGMTPGGDACVVTQADIVAGQVKPLPCVVERGAGSEDQEAARTFTDQELE